MNFVIPMAGRGQRFKETGFKQPKMLIEVHGKTMLEWSVGSLPLSLCSNLIFIALREHNESYNLEKKMKSIFGSRFNTQLILLDRITGGQAQTVLAAKEIIDTRKPLLIFNIDTYFVSSTLEKSLLRNDTDGVLGAFRSTEARFSFASLDKNGYIEKTAEKIAISDYALTGLYHFSNTESFLKVAENRIEKNVTDKGEFYIAPMYNDLIKLGEKFIIDVADEHWILGTPEELHNFETSFSPSC